MLLLQVVLVAVFSKNVSGYSEVILRGGGTAQVLQWLSSGVAPAAAAPTSGSATRRAVLAVLVKTRAVHVAPGIVVVVPVIAYAVSCQGQIFSAMCSLDMFLPERGLKCTSDLFSGHYSDVFMKIDVALLY